MPVDEKARCSVVPAKVPLFGLLLAAASGLPLFGVGTLSLRLAADAPDFARLPR